MPRSRVLALVLAVVLGAPAAADAAKPKRYLVSLGDSYVAGYQATGYGTEETTRNGFAYQVPQLARTRGCRLKLVNLGGGKVELITVAIGGNDVTACAIAPDPIACVGAAVTLLEQNVTATALRLREAAGDKPPERIVGITYPDVLLGKWVGAMPTRRWHGYRSSHSRPDQPGADAGVRCRRRQARRRHGRDRRIRLARRAHDAGAIWSDPRAGRAGVQADLLLRRARHPRPHERLTG